MKITRQQALEILKFTEKDPSQDEIKAAYRKYAMIYHPDKYEGDKQEGTEHFKKISLAYKKLTDDSDEENEADFTDEYINAFFQRFCHQQFFYTNPFAHPFAHPFANPFAHPFAHSFNYDSSCEESGAASFDSSSYGYSDDGEYSFSLRRKRMQQNKTTNNASTMQARVTAEEAERNAAQLILEEERKKNKTAKRRQKKKKQRQQRKMKQKCEPANPPPVATEVVTATAATNENIDGDDADDEKEVEVEASCQVRSTKDAPFGTNENNEIAEVLVDRAPTSDTSCRSVLSSCENKMSNTTRQPTTKEQHSLDATRECVLRGPEELAEIMENELCIYDDDDDNDFIDVVEEDDADLVLEEEVDVEEEDDLDVVVEEDVDVVEENEEVRSSKDMNPDESMMHAGSQGNHCAQSGNLEEALMWFSKGLQETHGSAEIRKILLGNRSFCFEQLQRFKEALHDANEGLQLDPDWLKGWFRRGRAFIGLNDAAEAVFAFKKVLELDPENADAAKELRDAEFLQLQAMGFCHSDIMEAFSRGGPSGFSWVLDFLLQKSQNPSYGPQFATVAAAGIPVARKLMTPVNFSASASVSTAPVQLRKNTTKESNPKIDLSNKNRYCNLWVGNVNPRSTESELTKLFSQCGTILSVRIMPAKKYFAFVNFNSPDAASRAMASLQGHLHYDSRLLLRFQENQQPALHHSSNNGEEKECCYWRTGGCKNRKLCPFKHPNKSRGILLNKK